MRFATVCSGIEAASAAWEPHGWEPVFFSEIEPFPCAVLAHHYPNVPNYGDMTQFEEWPDADVDVLAGGTPCQSFSVAGLRAGLADPRGNLMLTYLAIARRYRPRWVVWENVPGVLSSNGGRDFGAFLRGLGECGYGFAYRVLDAQFCRTRRFPRAVPQRRRRVFVVGYLGDWRPAAAVLFDAESLRGNPAPRREAGERPSAAVIKGAAIGRKPENGPQRGDVIADGSCFTLTTNETHATITSHDPACTLTARERKGALPEADLSTVVAFGGCNTTDHQGDKAFGPGDAWPCLAAQGGNNGGGAGGLLVQPWAAVRRLTPVECERLQGFPDGFTRIPYRGKPADKCPDGPRYKALGNSWAVNCADWLAERIGHVEAILQSEAA